MLTSFLSLPVQQSVENAVGLRYSSTTSASQTAEQVATDDVIDFGEDIDFSDLVTLEESGIMVSMDGLEDGITVETTGDGTLTEVGTIGNGMEASVEGGEFSAESS